MLQTCVILNGPPGIGKDTIADMFVHLGYSKHMFKSGLYVRTADLFDVDLEDLVMRASDRILKEQPWDALVYEEETVSPRDALIITSERVIKPTEGSDYFGQMAAQACLDEAKPNVIFSDGGFQSEILPLQEIFDDVIIIRLQREGFNFIGDSRDYLYGFPNTYDVDLVEGKPHKAVFAIATILEDALGT